MELLKRIKFWIGLGLLVLVSGVVFAVAVLPARARNAEKFESFEKQVAGVTQAESKAVPSRKDAPLWEAERAKAEEKLAEARAFSTEAGDVLSQPIPHHETGEFEEYDSSRAGLWKNVYAERMKMLEEEIKKSFSTSPDRLVTIRDFADSWPTLAEMASETRDYWVYRYFLETLASINDDALVVPHLRRFEFKAAPERLIDPQDGKAFRPRAFEIGIACEFGSIPSVIHRLLECPLGVEVTSLEMDRREDMLSLGAGEVEKDEKKPAPGAAAAQPTGPVGAPAGAGADMAARMAAAGAARGQAMAAAAMGAGRGPGRVSGPSGGRAPGVPRGRGPAAGAGATGKADDREAPEALVEVTIRGYVKETLPPKKAQEKEPNGDAEA